MINEDFNDPEELDPEENLKMDNKIKRLELEMKGAKFIEHNPDGISLPPEVEAQMLDQILAFEKIKHDAKEVQIYDYLGKPKFKPLDTLASEEVILENARLLKLMSKKGILLASIEDIEDRVMYKFIIEEFFYKKMLDVPIKGFIRHYIYEEFHPNEKLNAERTAEFFIHAFMNELDSMPIDVLCREEARPYLKDFKNLYARFELKDYQVLTSDIKKIKGQITAYLEFEAFIENSLKSHKYEGDIAIGLRRRKGNWQISELIFPKLGLSAKRIIL